MSAYYQLLERMGKLPPWMKAGGYSGALPQPMNAPPGPSMGPQPIMGGNARNPALGAVPFPDQQWKSATGPLAAPQAAPPKGRGFLGAIDDVFGGPDMKNLTPEQQKAARRRGLLAFGAQMLTATDPRGNRAQGLSALGQGVMAAQGGYGQGIEQGMMANMERQRAAMYAALAPLPGENTEQRYARYLRMLDTAVLQQDKNAMTAISQALNTMPKTDEVKQAEPEFVTGPDKMLYRKVPVSAQFPNGLAPTGVQGKEDGPSEMFLALQSQRRVQNSNALNDDYMKEQTPYMDAYQPITEALSLVEPAKAGNAAAQINLVYAFITALDRRSTVREGEVNLVRGASSVKQQIDQLKDKYGSLEAAVIPDELVDQIAGILRTSSANLEKGMQGTERRYRARAKDADVSPDIFRPAPRAFYVDPEEAKSKWGAKK